MKVVITGHSDDCIEVDGDLSEEFCACDTPRYLHFGDGTVVKCKYDNDGIWRFAAEKVGVGTQASHLAGDVAEDTNDRLELSGDLRHVECWSEAAGPTVCDLIEAIEGEIENGELAKLEAAALHAIHDALKRRINKRRIKP